MIDLELLVRFMQVYAFQPATAVWRAIEVQALLPFLPRSGIGLDLGCGDGKFAFIARRKTRADGLTLVGVDSDREECGWAVKTGIYARVHNCDAAAIPEPTASFDHVLANSVLEHIPGIEETIAEVARLLRKGGAFVFTVPSPGFHHCLQGARHDLTRREEYLKDIDLRLGHLRYWRGKEWEAILARHGFLIQQQVKYFTCSEVRRWEQLSRFTAGILFRMGQRQHTPIELQRTLGLRAAQQRITLPAGLARLLATVVMAGLQDSQTETGCLLILATKPSGE